MVDRIKRIIKKILKYDDEPLQFIGSAKPNYKIGEGTYVNGAKVYCWDSRVNITIGKYCSLADGLTIVAGGEHDKDWVSTYPFIMNNGWHELDDLMKPRYKGDINIGHDVWIAQNVTILSGVNIGTGAIIAAGCVVTSDVPPYAIHGGVPNKLIYYRFSEDLRSSILQSKWWDWDLDTIHKRFPDFVSPEQFVSKYVYERQEER